MKFDLSKISDQKRYVRGEHWLLARTLLRRRDERHAAKWRVLTLAGGSPRGEMTAIRELMPKAHVVAVDIDPSCLEAAIDAGADDVVQCDALAYERVVNPNAFHPGDQTGVHRLPRALRDRAKFDVVNLDLCGSVSSSTKKCLGLYIRDLVTSRGIAMVTFSYGRDVAEMFLGLGRKWMVRPSNAQFNTPHETCVLPPEVPDSVAGRLMYLGQQRYLRSVMVYRGAEMPMCSLLFQTGSTVYKEPISFVKVGPGDFELAVVYPDSANLYDCPRERIESLRRKFAAIKASVTRTAKASLFDDDVIASLVETTA